MAEQDMMSWYHERLADLGEAGRRRQLRATRPLSSVELERDGQPLLAFCSNDYLGLSYHPAVRQAAATAAVEFGMGSRAAALVTGYSDLQVELEGRIAQLKGTDMALVFPTGYAANIGLLSALGGPDATIFSDRLNHASIIDGCRLARSEVVIYRHGDVDHLQSLLQAKRNRRCIVVTESLFSMDGDLAPLSDLVALKATCPFELVVDSAHATLVYGDRGGGYAQAVGVGEAVDYHVGTLSKAVGALGGFVATCHMRRDWLLNTARSFIFTTALPAPVLAAASASIATAALEPQRREQLWSRIEQLGSRLGRRIAGPIASLVLGSEARALRVAARLREAGLLVAPIRPPTVPPGSSRLRVTLSAAHTEAQVDRLATALHDVGALDVSEA